MREFFYYFRHKETKAPQVTVCLLHDEEGDMWHRGMAICSLSEEPHKLHGRNKARGKARQAIHHRRDVSLVYRPEADEALRSAGITRASVGFTGKYNAVLTKHECKLLGLDNDDKRDIPKSV